MYNNTLIRFSIREESFSVATIFISKWDVNVNQRDKYYNTFLHMLAAAPFSERDAPEDLILMNVKLAEI